MNNEGNTTVKELIQILKEFPDDMPVLVYGYESGFERFYTPSLQSVKHEPENMYYDGEYQLADDENEKSIEVIVLQRMFRDD